MQTFVEQALIIFKLNNIKPTIKITAKQANVIHTKNDFVGVYFLLHLLQRENFQNIIWITKNIHFEKKREC